MNGVELYRQSYDNFSHFTNRFEMPMKNESSNLYYSFDLGLIHFVSYNTEVYFNMTGNGAASGDGNDCVKTQYAPRHRFAAQHNLRQPQHPLLANIEVLFSSVCQCQLLTFALTLTSMAGTDTTGSSLISRVQMAIERLSPGLLCTYPCLFSDSCLSCPAQYK